MQADAPIAAQADDPCSTPNVAPTFLPRDSRSTPQPTRTALPYDPCAPTRTPPPLPQATLTPSPTTQLAPTFIPRPTCDDSVGLYRPSTSQFFLKMRLGDLEATHVVTYGTPGDMPIAGKWTGDGLDRIGVFRAGQWFLTQTVTDQPQAAYNFTFGAAGDKPVVGDWNNNGTETAGVYRPSTNGSGTFYLRNSLSTGFADRTITLNFGQSAEAVPVAGRWSSSVGYGVGIVENGVFKLVNLPATGSPLTFTAPTYTETFGSALDKPFVFMGAHHIPAV